MAAGAPVLERLAAPPTERPKDVPPRRDVRLRTAGLILATIASIGIGVRLLPESETGAAKPRPVATGFDELKQVPLGKDGDSGRAREAFPMPVPEPTAPTTSRGREARALLKQAKAEIAARRHDQALATLNRIRPLDPENPEAYLRIGEALLGKKDYATARDFFAAAINRNPELPGAYFGYAVASEGLGDLESALGGMRSYLHVEIDKAPGRLPVAQARSAIWEWESKLGRGPWGPTKGIPPGFSADEIKRDGRGTAVKIPKRETMRPDGTMDYEIKAGDRFPDQWRK